MNRKKTNNQNKTIEKRLKSIYKLLKYSAFFLLPLNKIKSIKLCKLTYRE